MELQLNHAHLQLQSIVNQEQKMRSERDNLQYVVAEAEQDILLLEVRLYLHSGSIHDNFILTNLLDR